MDAPGGISLRDWLEIGGLAATFLGFVFVAYQVRRLGQSVRNSAQASVYAQAQSLRELIVAYPETRRFVLGDAAIAPDHPEHDRVRTIGEAFLNYLEQLAIQRDSLGGANWRSWRAFIERTAAASPTLLGIYKENRAQYAPDLQKILDELE